MYYILFQLFKENQDALLALPSNVKTIIMITLGLWIGGAILSQAKKIFTCAIMATIIYFAAVYLGLI